MFTLVVAGEMIFGLPFNIPRYFRPTLLEAFDFTNTQLGDVFAAYGVMAMLAYFPGGVLADRFSTRVLMTTSLIATAAGVDLTPQTYAAALAGIGSYDVAMQPFASLGADKWDAGDAVTLYTWDADKQDFVAGDFIDIG